MPAVPAAAAGSVTAQVGRRWREIDPLLPAPAALRPGCGTQFSASSATGQLAAAGSCEHWAGAPGSLDLTWGAARRFQLTAQVAGPEVAQGLDRLLPLWRDHLAGLPGTGAEDTAAVVSWPSRDVDGVAALLRHGLAPRGVIAARVTGRPGGQGPAGEVPPRGVAIRRAGPADLDAVVRLGMETVRYDARFGGVTERPWTADALRHEAAGLLAGPPAWTWLAERGSTPIGMLIAERPVAARWIAPMTRLAPVAYLLLMIVLPDDRARGVGTALAARLHHEIAAAGVAVTLLHHEQTNPLSAPFWARQGYRPLWTSWEARPAGTIR